MMDKSEKKPINKENALTIVMLVIVFALPPLAAYIMYFGGFMPDARSNKGTLISPVVALPEMALQTPDGKTFSIKEHAGKWTLLMVAKNTCNELCKKNIYLMRQVRKSLGKDNTNVLRLLITEHGVQDKSFDTFLQDYPKMPVLAGTTDTIQHFIQVFTGIITPYANRVFIIDPHGSLMMYYEQDLNPKDLLSDLKRLIMVNQDASTSQSE